VYHDREAELQARVDRRRVKIAFSNASEPGAARSELRGFKASLGAAGLVEPESSVTIDMECDPVPAEDAG
jgi:hypothetical protein